MKNNRLFIIAFTLMGLIGLFFVGMSLYQGQQEKELSFIAQEDFKRFVPEYAPRLGTSSPKVYLVEFLDPECETCREFYPHVKMMLKDYEEDLQLVIRYAPFHPNSRFAISILEASRKQGKYWETLEVLLRFQPEWGSHHHPRPELIWKYLPEAGVDVEKIRQDMADPAIDKLISHELSEATALGVRATPEFFVNGRRLEPFGLSELRALIEHALREAK